MLTTPGFLGYRLICKTCKDRNIEKIYEGETSRSARIRSKELLLNEKSKNVLYKHKEMDHKCEQIEILMEITKTFKDPLTRQAKEGSKN